MGLDMNAYAVASDKVAAGDVDVKLPEEAVEIAYWRKFNHLHGWMERLYRHKGGTREDFNCTTVKITSEDLVELKKALDNKIEHLPATSGFFFGNSEWYEEYTEDVLKFIKEAAGELAVGNNVYYSSWW